MDLADLHTALRLNDKIIREDIGIFKQFFKSAYSLSKYFIYLTQKKKDKLPFHLNIIDELWANENAHSRIFNKLLQYQDEARYQLWELFLNHIGLGEIKVVRPVFVTEKHRIDILIEDEFGKYAVIFENKIHGAIDQSEQIERYINRLTQRYYHLSEIYVLYLTREGGTPSEDSLSENMKEQLGHRYQEISYKYDILPWLEETALPLCRYRDTILISAIQQYIDHLQGLFHIRKLEQDMNKELIKFIEQELQLSDNSAENIEKIEDTISHFDQTKEYLVSLRKIHWFKNLENNLRRDYQGYPFVEIFSKYEQAEYYSKAGIRIDYKGFQFSLLIEATKNPYYGAGKHHATNNKEEKVESFLKDIFPEAKKTNVWWYGYIDSSYDIVYEDFKGFANSVIKKIEEI